MSSKSGAAADKSAAAANKPLAAADTKCGMLLYVDSSGADITKHVAEVNHLTCS